MAEIKITDLVPQETIDELADLDKKMKDLASTYTATAKELAKGLSIEVKVIGDIDKLDKLYIEKTREAAATTEQLRSVMERQRQVYANTTNTASRLLMEQERINKTQREAYTDTQSFKELLEKVNGSYEQRVKRLVELNQSIQENKDRQNALNKAYKEGKVSQDDYMTRMTKLTAAERELKQAKSDLTVHMKNEEREMQSVEGSYRNLSQRLELMKKAYKDLTEEERDSPMGKEMEMAIQNLDAHLKDVAADMGEFQRNVGNYAIAGQNGVVSTESLMAAMQQEARTTQDLIDQTKILEDAKLMLDKEDANYQTILDGLNNKLEENKRRLTDVSDILGKQVKTVSEAEAQNKRLKEAINHIDLSAEGAKEKIKQMREQIAANNKIISEATGGNEKYAESLLSSIGLNTKFGSSFETLGSKGNFIEGLTTKIKAFGKTLTGILSNPWVLGFLGLGGVVTGAKWLYDYNKGLVEASKLTKNFTGLTGDAADKLTSQTQAISDHLGKGYNDTISAANTLVQQFGMSWEDALNRISDGIEAGADMNGKLLENIKQFAPAMRDCGVSAEELISILAETRNGIFDERGVQDIIKGGTRLRAMTKNIAESLDACGISSKKMQEDLAQGNITMLEAVQQVSAVLSELPENSQEAGQIIKNVFGRTAAEGGMMLIKSLAGVNTNLDKAKESMSDLGKLNREQLESQKRLTETMNSLFKVSGTSFQEMTAKAKTYINNGLVKIIEACVSIANWFIRIYNSSSYVRLGIQSLCLVFKDLWAIAKTVVKGVIDAFKSVGTMIEGIVNLDWDMIKQGWKDGFNSIKGDLEAMSKEMGANSAKAYNNTLKGGLKEIKLGYDADLNGVGAKPQSPSSGDKPSGVESESAKKARDKAAKDAEKQAKEELKRIQSLEDSKIAILADGHEKELALIRQKFKKKMDKIKGDSESENELRLQLAEECAYEVAECERKYQENIEKINLENRLAFVKKGSQEELDLKLAQLEKQHSTELKEAEKTGADVNLINEKFYMQRLQMQEDYATQMIEELRKQKTKEQDARDSAHIVEMASIEMEYAKKLKAANGNNQKMDNITKEYNRKRLEKERAYAEECAQAAIDSLEEILKNEKLSEKDRLKVEQELVEAKAKLEQTMADNAIESINEVVKADEDGRDRRIAIAKELLNALSDMLNSINSLISQLYDNRLNKIDEEQNAFEEASDAEAEKISELVEKKVITEEEGEARKRAAAAATAKKNKELEKEKMDLKIKQAKWEKANAIIQATISTSLAVLNALNTQPFWLGIAMAAVATAMGAVEIATIASQPIPAYAKGTDYHKGGPAVVGDGGRQEVITFGNRAWLTSDKPLIVDIPQGAKVFPSIDLFNQDFTPQVQMPVAESVPAQVVVNNDYTRLENRITELAYLIRQQTKMQRAIAYESNYEHFKNSRI